MADDVELINGMKKNFRDNKDQKFKNSRQEKIQRLVKGCSFFSQQGRENLNPLRPPEPQITSQQRLNTVSQIDIPSLRNATAVSGEAGQNYFFLNKLNGG